MVDDALLNRLRALLSFYCGVPEDRLSPASKPETTEGWDSVANLWLINAIEEEFEITVATRDAIRLRTLGDIVVYVGEKVREKASGQPKPDGGS